MVKKQTISNIRKIIGLIISIFLLFVVFSFEHPKQQIELNYKHPVFDVDDVRICWRNWEYEKYSIIVLRNLSSSRLDCSNAIYEVNKENNEYYLDGREFFEHYRETPFNTSIREYSIKIDPSSYKLRFTLINLSDSIKPKVRFSGD